MAPDLSHHLFGDLYLENPVQHVSQHSLKLLQELRPYLKEPETRLDQARGNYDSYFDQKTMFSHFGVIYVSSVREDRIMTSFAALKATEPYLFNHPRLSEDLCHPSGSLEAQIVHDLRNPTFTTHSLSGQEAADDTNPCLRILLESGFNKENSLI